MATKKADLPDGADSGGPALISMEDLRARLDAPLFHRDDGLGSPAQLPRLRELSLDHAVETPEAAEVVAPPRPILVSFSDMLARTSLPEPLAPVEPETVEPETVEPETVEPITARPSAVEAELNRLAFLPDQEEPVGRVIVPVIAPSEPRETMAVPVLSQHEMYNPRVMAAPTSKRKVFEAAFESSTSPKRRQKGVIKRLLSLIVILAVLGGGLYAAKYYLLDPKWDSEVEPLVQDVEAARQLQFGHAVDVTTLSGDEYSSRIARYALGIKGSNEDQVAGELRALGLLTGAFDLRAIGLAALPETPAFYDAGSEQIYVVEGLPVETYRFAMYRALTTALLDQEYGWGSRTSDASPSVVRGTRALYEADALATASGMLTPAGRALVLDQRTGLFTTFSVLTTPAHFATAVAGRLGVSLRAFVESVPVTDRASVLSKAVITDGQALDLRRLVSGVAENSEGLHSEGMLFWYHVLASRLDPATAWNNVLPLQRDDVVVSQGPTGYCVSAVLTVSADALAGVTAAFGAWAASAPAESTTTVTAALVDGNGQLSISACDPGLAVQTNHGLPSLTLGGAPLRSEQYRLLIVAQPAMPRTQAACAVYGGDSVSINDERPVLDGVEGWLVPAVHPSPDPNRAGCI